MLRNSKYLIQITKRQSWQQNRNWNSVLKWYFAPQKPNAAYPCPKKLPSMRLRCEGLGWPLGNFCWLAGWLKMMMTKRRSSVARRLPTLIINNRQSTTTVDSIKTGQHPITKSACYSRKRPKPASQWYWYCEDRAGPLATKKYKKETSKLKSKPEPDKSKADIISDKLECQWNW